MLVQPQLTSFAVPFVCFSLHDHTPHLADMQQAPNKQLKCSKERSHFQDSKNSAGWYQTGPEQYRQSDLPPSFGAVSL